MSTLAPVSVVSNAWTLVYDSTVSGDFVGSMSTPSSAGGSVIIASEKPPPGLFGTHFSNRLDVAAYAAKGDKIYARTTPGSGVVVLDSSLGVGAMRSGGDFVQENADWNATSGVAEILNKPETMPPTAHTHPISDVDGLKVALDAKYSTPAGKADQYLRGDGSLAPFPAIPAAQVSADWNASSGPSSILNKPTTFPPSAHTHAISEVSGLQSALSGKYDKPTGTASQYLRGDGTPAAFPAIPTVKRMETYSATTDANGLVSITYPTPFAVAPNVQPGPPPSADMSWVLVSSTATGCSLRLVQRATLTVLSLQVLAGTVTNVAGSPAKILVVEA